MYQNIVLHIPHSSTKVPEYLSAQKPSAIKALRQKSFYLIDYYTHRLFLPAGEHPCIHSIMAPYMRTLVDMERMLNDPLEKEGLGIVSQWAVDLFGREFRSQGAQWYLDYHRLAMKKINALNSPLLIDCHSFSAHPTPLCSCPPDVDICIGWNEDETKPDLGVIAQTFSLFLDNGYSVGINNPFSNSKTFPGASGYHSLMIEINKRCYMDEQTLDKTAGFDKLRDILEKLYYSILLS